MGANQRTRKRGNEPALPRLLGERLCLDYVNTVEDPLGDRPEEFLHGYPDLARWGRHVGILSVAAADRLRVEGERCPANAAATFARAIALRDALT
ncbi:MAG: ABATE domain-containing protein, partial [Chloroflexota bacterium]|nr:ABATE domain-containing protein [Chloroflexota bacterium]